MPKTPKSAANKARDAAEKSSEFRTIPGGILLCKLCEKEVGCEKAFNYEHHRSSQQHKQRLSAGAGSSSGNLSAMLTADHFRPMGHLGKCGIVVFKKLGFGQKNYLRI